MIVSYLVGDWRGRLDDLYIEADGDLDALAT